MCQQATISAPCCFVPKSTANLELCDIPKSQNILHNTSFHQAFHQNIDVTRLEQSIFVGCFYGFVQYIPSVCQSVLHSSLNIILGCKDNVNYLFHQEKHKKILFYFVLSSIGTILKYGGHFIPCPISHQTMSNKSRNRLSIITPPQINLS